MHHKTRSLWQASRHAWRGLLTATRRERSLRLELGLAGVGILLGVAFQISLYQWLLLLLVIGIIVGLELINTAFEALADVVVPHHHPTIGYCKDVAAAAVFIMSVVAIIIGVAVFIAPLLKVAV